MAETNVLINVSQDVGRLDEMMLALREAPHAPVNLRFTNVCDDGTADEKNEELIQCLLFGQLPNVRKLTLQSADPFTGEADEAFLRLENYEVLRGVPLQHIHFDLSFPVADVGRKTLGGADVVEHLFRILPNVRHVVLKNDGMEDEWLYPRHLQRLAKMTKLGTVVDFEPKRRSMRFPRMGA